MLMIFFHMEEEDRYRGVRDIKEGTAAADDMLQIQRARERGHAARAARDEGRQAHDA